MTKRVFLACWLAFAALAANATSVIPLYLEDIISQAATAFQGTCIDNRSARDSQTGYVVTYTTFQVEDVLKGDVPATYTIKQVGGDLPDEHLHVKMSGVPNFEIGKSYVVFLAGVSPIGFSSPIGLFQGKFDIVPGATEPDVQSGRDFRELTAHIPAANIPAVATKKLAGNTPVTKMGLAEFKQLVRQQVGAAR